MHSKTQQSQQQPTPCACTSTENRAAARTSAISVGVGVGLLTSNAAGLAQLLCVLGSVQFLYPKPLNQPPASPTQAYCHHRCTPSTTDIYLPATVQPG